MEIWPGKAYPLGAVYDGAGTNFSLFSEPATRVELCVFADDGQETRVDLPEVTAFCWHGYVPGLTPGTRYGFRVHGPFEPEHGLWCHPSKLLLDPYAKAIDGEVEWNAAVFAYQFDAPESSVNTDDSAAYMPKSVVVDDAFDWEQDTLPRTPLHKSVIYELHVKGFTMQHPELPEELRGRYLGLAHPAIIDHLKQLGVTAVELLPIHQFIHDSHLVEKGLRNYWGYNSIGFLAPHNAYATSQRGAQVQEFKQMVKALHAAGIEVILDVVYNHTAEGNQLGPVLCFKGIDNPAYYRLMADHRRYYMDYTGTGNSLNMRHPHVLQIIMDSLRYWVTEMHVDGFRFDLAATLARGLHDVDKLSAFFDLIQQDPVVSQAKLIAEPWDIGDGGYHVGNFPPLWCEWNGQYRDCVRDYWRSQDQTMSEFAFRFTGSSDLYEGTGRRPYASVNFVTAHDGFSLRDLVSYNDKRNEANGEDSRDGESHNRSWNGGVEGPTRDRKVNAIRARQQRNFLATLFLSQGVPMMLAGDELGRTQGGNNNAYCQDNEVSWVDWSKVDQPLLAFTRKLIAFRHDHPVFRRRRWFQGTAIHGLLDIEWFTPDGNVMDDEHWSAGYGKSFMAFLNGEAIPSRGPQGQHVKDDSFLVLFNGHYEALDFVLPAEPYGGSWERVIDTVQGEIAHEQALHPAGEAVTLAARALMVMQKRG